MRLRLLSLALIFACGSAAAQPFAPQSLELAKIGGRIGAGAEISAYDPATRRLFVVPGGPILEVLDLTNPAAPSLITTIDLAALGGAANSVDVANGLVAVAVEATVAQDPGSVAIYNTAGVLQRTLAVGALPDNLTFTPDGQRILVANEGEPNDEYTVDPMGSISVINLAGGVAAATVTTLGFTDFNVGGPRNAELPAGVRIFGPNASVAQDLEPEYITTNAAGTVAYVIAQEANALIVVDLVQNRIASILALGQKNHNLAGNGLDPSDRDSAINGGINIRNWPVFGFYQPDAIDSFVVNGQTYLITANEGDTRDYDGFAEEVRLASATLDPVVFPDGATLRLNENLGRLTILRGGDLDGDTDIDQIQIPGSRSITIWNGTTGALVWDSGDQFERETAARTPTLFNSNPDVGEDPADSFDGRSDNKGPEPESVVVGDVGGVPVAFTGLERIGGIFTHDLRMPSAPPLLGYTSAVNPPAGTGDISPEGLIYLDRTRSPNGQPLVVVSYEVSGTVGVFGIADTSCVVGSVVRISATVVRITGECPRGLDLWAETDRGLNQRRIAANLTVAGSLDFTTNEPGRDVFFTTARDSSQAYGAAGERIESAPFGFPMVAVPTLGLLGQLLMGLGLAATSVLMLRRR